MDDATTSNHCLLKNGGQQINQDQLWYDVTKTETEEQLVLRYTSDVIPIDDEAFAIKLSRSVNYATEQSPVFLSRCSMKKARHGCLP